MKTLITLFVLFFSSLVVAESFKCTIFYKDITGTKDQSYEIFINTGNPNKDDLVDGAAYLAIAGEIRFDD